MKILALKGKMFQYVIHKNALKSQYYYPDLIELQNYYPDLIKLQNTPLTYLFSLVKVRNYVLYLCM